MKPTLLIVDDIKVVRARLSEQLGNDFDIVGEAASAKEALELCQRLKPQLVLMDLVMPERTGIDATRDILSLMDPKPKVIILSGVSEESYAAEALDAGASEYLLKPISPEKLISVLRAFSDTNEP